MGGKEASFVDDVDEEICCTSSVDAAGKLTEAGEEDWADCTNAEVEELSDTDSGVVLIEELTADDSAGAVVKLVKVSEVVPVAEGDVCESDVVLSTMTGAVNSGSTARVWATYS